ncbi:MAG TPA: hypothetical protein VN693_05420 [Rhodanobacteraceae bacterium]|nr:hypothetical protein [Rhodanobacteraceae bacterium]
MRALVRFVVLSASLALPAFAGKVQDTGSAPAAAASAQQGGDPVVSIDVQQDQEAARAASTQSMIHRLLPVSPASAGSALPPASARSG